MNWEDLIAIARVLAAGAVSPHTGRPRPAELNRAVSTIYYAAFHTLEVWPESHLPGFVLRKTDVSQSDMT